MQAIFCAELININYKWNILLNSFSKFFWNLIFTYFVIATKQWILDFDDYIDQIFRQLMIILVSINRHTIESD